MIYHIITVMGTTYSITEKFDTDLAVLLADKILKTNTRFDKNTFIERIEKACIGKGYTQRIELFADELNKFLPYEYRRNVETLIAILGDENPNETGMFTHYYWIMPISKYIEKYGLDDFDSSIKAIEEVTKRNTGEYAIRPFIRKYPERALEQMKYWATSSNFHLRRLASEGLRPKLPWAPKLDTFLDRPLPVFDILELLKYDEVKFVKKSVANHLTDWLKVNPQPTIAFIRTWQKENNTHTRWMIKHATRKIIIE